MPVDYNVNIKNPFEAFREVVQTQYAMEDRDRMNAEYNRQQQAMAQQQAQQAQMQQRMREAQADMQSIYENPTAKGIYRMQMLYPDLGKQIEPQLSAMSAKVKENAIGNVSRVYSAMQSGNTAAAKKELQLQIDAARSSGDENSASQAEALLEQIDSDPNRVTTSTGFLLSQLMGPEKFAENLKAAGTYRKEQELLPSESKKAASEANLAHAVSIYGEQSASAELAMKGVKIKEIEEEIGIKKEANRIAAMNAQNAREGNSIKRQEQMIQLEEKRRALNEKVLDRFTDGQAVVSDVDNAISTAQRLLDMPQNVWGSAAGPVSSRMPTVSQETADFEALLAQLKSQAFLTQVKKMAGTGPLAVAEGEKLERSMSALDLSQSPESLRKNVGEIQRQLGKMRDNYVKKYGITAPEIDMTSAGGVAPTGLVRRQSQAPMSAGLPDSPQAADQMQAGNPPPGAVRRIR
jgi:hypothetical protein